MSYHGSVLEGQTTADLHLKPSEYRLLADLLYEHLETNNLQDAQLEQLVNRLYVLAVRAVHPLVDQPPPRGSRSTGSEDGPLT